MDFSQNVLTLIPQAAPFVMISNLLFSDEQSARTNFDILPENIFVKDDFFEEPGLVENIAQTAAAKVGYYAKLNNIPVPVGYIGSIKDLEIFDLPKVGGQIETEIIIENQIFDVTIITGKVMCNGSLMAKCEMKIFLSKT